MEIGPVAAQALKRTLNFEELPTPIVSLALGTPHDVVNLAIRNLEQSYTLREFADACIELQDVRTVETHDFTKSLKAYFIALARFKNKIGDADFSEFFRRQNELKSKNRNPTDWSTSDEDEFSGPHYEQLLKIAKHELADLEKTQIAAMRILRVLRQTIEIRKAESAANLGPNSLTQHSLEVHGLGPTGKSGQNESKYQVPLAVLSTTTIAAALIGSIILLTSEIQQRDAAMVALARKHSERKLGLINHGALDPSHDNGGSLVAESV